MSFSRAQQGLFRPLVQRAWGAECGRLGARREDAVARREWYEGELERACGKRSSSDCTGTRDFEAAMAHFEGLEGAGFFWELRRVRGDARRILHEVRALAAEFECEEEYMLGIARQALRREAPPRWEELGAEDLLTILRALKIQVRRQVRRGDGADRVRVVEEEGDPF